MLREKVDKLLQEIIEEKDLFLIECNISADNQIKVLVDSIRGVNIADLQAVSRHIEHNLDREEEDFALEVSSPGLDQPFTVKEQYLKNKGRKVEVKLSDGEEITATLEEVTDEAIQLYWKAREKKPVGKGKHTVEYRKEVPFDHIVEAKVVITI